MIKICTGKGNEADVSSWRNAACLGRACVNFLTSTSLLDIALALSSFLKKKIMLAEHFQNHSKSKQEVWRFPRCPLAASTRMHNLSCYLFFFSD